MEVPQQGALQHGGRQVERRTSGPATPAQGGRGGARGQGWEGRGPGAGPSRRLEGGRTRSKMLLFEPPRGKATSEMGLLPCIVSDAAMPNIILYTQQQS